MKQILPQGAALVAQPHPAPSATTTVNGHYANTTAPNGYPDTSTPAATHGTLNAKHRRQLEDESAISAAAIEARGYFSVLADANGAAKLRELGFDAKQSKLGECLVIPIHNWRGEVVSHAIRPTIPRNDARGKPRKYELPTGSTNTLDIAQLTRADLDDPSKDAIFTEGAKKADAAASHGFVAISLNGVYGMRGKNLKGGIANLNELDEIPLKGKAPNNNTISRRLLFCHDSDWEEKDGVFSAMHRLAGAAERRGATVKMVTLPTGPNGEKTGLDDYFARGGTVEGLYQLARDLVGVAERDRMKRESAKTEKVRQVAESAKARNVPTVENNGRQLPDKLADLGTAIEAHNGVQPVLFRGLG